MEGKSFTEIKEQVCVLIMRVITSSYACAKIPRTVHKKAGSPFYCYDMGFLGKESAYNAAHTGDLGLVPGSGRSLGGGHGNPLQYSYLENPMD